MLQPAENLLCLGHVTAIQAFEEARFKQRLPPVWLFLGSSGIGKRTLAYYLARTLFAKEQSFDAQTPFVRRLAVGSHGDFFLVKEGQMENIRCLRSFLQKAPVEGMVRVVLLPRADHLTNAATNALLKTLEEPAEQTIFFLTAQHQGALLPTLRSRCRIVRLQSLQEETFVLHLKTLCQAQGLSSPSASQLSWLWKRTKGALGQAVRLLNEDLEKPFEDIQSLLSKGLVPSTHPDSSFPFQARYFSIWRSLSCDILSEIFLSWAQEFSVQDPSRVTGAFSYAYDRLYVFLKEAQTFHLDPLATAITAFDILREGIEPSYSCVK